VAGQGGQQGEDPKARIDRELIELLNELRVALPGVQVLFAFLLILPFSQGWDRVTDIERTVYFVSLLLTAGATVLLIAPSSYHRLRFRSSVEEKEHMLFISNRLTIAGMAMEALAISGTVFVIGDVLFGEGLAMLVAALVLAWFVIFWYLLPLSRKRQAKASGKDGESTGG
jgi:Family of unknown function (DUF6328)